MELINKELKCNFKYLICFVLFIIIYLAIYIFLPYFGSSDLLNAIYSIIMIGDTIMLGIASVMTVITISDIVKLLKLRKNIK